jgi:hypothetical protein
MRRGKEAFVGGLIIVLAVIFLLDFVATGSKVAGFCGITYLLLGFNLIILVEHKLHLVFTAALIIAILAFTAIFISLIPVLVLVGVILVVILSVLLSIKTGLIRTDVVMIVTYIIGVVVCIAIVVFAVYVGFFLAEQLNIPRLVAIALTIPAVIVIAAMVVKGLLETRKWERTPV